MLSRLLCECILEVFVDGRGLGGDRNRHQNTTRQRGESLCSQSTSGSLSEMDNLEKLAILLNPQTLTTSHQSAKSVKTTGKYHYWQCATWLILHLRLWWLLSADRDDWHIYTHQWKQGALKALSTCLEASTVSVWASVCKLMVDVGLPAVTAGW